MTGRFLSADPLVQSPFESQSFNRYSYVFNNPLSFTDPSGFKKFHGRDDGSTSTSNYDWDSFLDRVLGPNPRDHMPDGGGDPNLPSSDAGVPASQGQHVTAVPPGVAVLAPQGVVNVTTGDALQSLLAGVVNSVADTAATFTNLMISIGDFNGDAELVGPWQPMTPRSNYFGREGKTIGDGLQVVQGGRGLGKTLDAARGTSSLVTNIPTVGRKFNQLAQRGWSRESINTLVNNPFTTRAATNRATGNAATAFVRADGHYVVRDNITGELVQMSDTRFTVGTGAGQWVPDSSIVDPFIPGP
jgi:hypothetical protein